MGNPNNVSIFDRRVSDPNRVWKRLETPTTPQNARMRELIEEHWTQYCAVAEGNFITGIQGAEFSQRWWEMYLWGRLKELTEVTAIHQPGAGMPDALARWRSRNVYFECVSPTTGERENEIPTFPEDQIQNVPEDAIVLRLTSVIETKSRQATERYQRENKPIGPGSHYLIAVDTSQLRHSGFDDEFCLRALYPLGPQIVSIRQDGRADWYYDFKDEIKREGRSPVPTARFLGTKEYRLISAVLFCNANIGNIAAGDYPGFLLVHNFHAANSVSRKMFRTHHQFEWNGYSSLVRRTPRMAG